MEMMAGVFSTMQVEVARDHLPPVELLVCRVAAVASGADGGSILHNTGGGS